MSIPEVVTNAGTLFSAEALEQLDEFSGIGSQREEFDQIREHFERRRQNLEEDSTSNAVGFYFLGRVLHILGYTHSHTESLPHNGGRIDYTLFESSDEFQANVAGRGTSQLFAGSLAVLKGLSWDESLDGEGDDDASPDNPAFEFDDVLRQSGTQWAILTNGAVWRLYHRNTAGMLNTYYQVNLHEILETADFESFKFFGMFAKAALMPDSSGSSPARRLLA